VVKADGLAAGKGVVVTEDFDDGAGARNRSCLEASDRVVIEDYLAGPEVSLFVLCDGTTTVPLAPAQDFKRIGDGDTGPNTGGMGAYSPLPWAAGRHRRGDHRRRWPSPSSTRWPGAAPRSPACCTAAWR
jgi:phosphoribosylamine--glycine ligase